MKCFILVWVKIVEILLVIVVMIGFWFYDVWFILGLLVLFGI